MPRSDREPSRIQKPSTQEKRLTSAYIGEAEQNATKAAILAGYGPKHARPMGYKTAASSSTRFIRTEARSATSLLRGRADQTLFVGRTQ